MTKEEAIKYFKRHLDLYCVDGISREAEEMAIQALSREPCDNATLKDIFCMGCEYREQEPCDDTVSIRKDILKCRVGKIVAYNVEWLKKHWQMEMDIVCGVKPCDDAISRQAVLDGLKGCMCEDWVKTLFETMVKQLPSVTQKSGEWSHDGSHWKNRFICSECNYKLFDEPTNYCPNCGAKMESEEQE